MLKTNLVQLFSNLIHGNRPGADRPTLPANPENPVATEVYSKSADTLGVLYNKSSLKGSNPESGLELSSPAIGAETLQLKSEGGTLHANLGGKELAVKHKGAERFYSSSGAIGTDPANESIDLGNGRTVDLQKFKSSTRVEVSQQNSPVRLEMWFKEGEGAPHSVRLTQPGVSVAVGPESGFRAEDRQKFDGPTEGHLTVFSQGEFKSRDWNDGCCNPSNTSEADVARLMKASSTLLSDGGALFAPHSV